MRAQPGYISPPLVRPPGAGPALLPHGPGQPHHLGGQQVHHRQPGEGQVRPEAGDGRLPGRLVHSRLCYHWSSCYITALSLVESFIVMLRQLSNAIKTQPSASKGPLMP